jgi:hypothetical protein
MQLINQLEGKNRGQIEKPQSLNKLLDKPFACEATCVVVLHLLCTYQACQGTISAAAAGSQRHRAHCSSYDYSRQEQCLLEGLGGPAPGDASAAAETLRT